MKSCPSTESLLTIVSVAQYLTIHSHSRVLSHTASAYLEPFEQMNANAGQRITQIDTD